MKMKNQLTLIGVILLLVSCSTTKQYSKNVKQTLRDANTFVIHEISEDKTYGLSQKNPVEVGGAKNSEGPRNERRYLNALTGPNGEQVSYYRAGSCCPIKSKKGIYGIVMLDNYRVTWENSKDTISIYINMYDSGKLKAPYGFGIKK